MMSQTTLQSINYFEVWSLFYVRNVAVNLHTARSQKPHCCQVICLLINAAGRVSFEIFELCVGGVGVAGDLVSSNPLEGCVSRRVDSTLQQCSPAYSVCSFLWSET